jgi:arginine deiminase
MSESRPLYRLAIEPLIDAFESMGVAYHVAGSVATLAHGIARTTMDVDLVADLRRQHVEPLMNALQDRYYADADMIADAVQARTSFNLIHLDTMFKVDVFILKREAYDQAAFMRADLKEFGMEDDARAFFVETPEDVILNKLRWFRMGGETSERQWLDVQGVLRVQADALDFAYMRKWAPEIGVADLLERAIAEAGLAA